MLGAIAEVAPRVCTARELELLTLAAWSEDRIAEHFGVDVPTVQEWQESAHEKIREAIEADDRLAASARRRRK